jgi:hypothetical protein
LDSGFRTMDGTIGPGRGEVVGEPSRFGRDSMRSQRRPNADAIATCR